MISSFLEDDLATGIKILMCISLFIVTSLGIYTKGKIGQVYKICIFRYNHCTVYRVKYLKWPRCVPTGHA